GGASSRGFADAGGARYGCGPAGWQEHSAVRRAGAGNSSGRRARERKNVPGIHPAEEAVRVTGRAGGPAPGGSGGEGPGGNAERQEPRRRTARGSLGTASRSRIGGSGQAGVTFSACGPFGPCVTSKVTCWFSSRDRKPVALIAE